MAESEITALRQIEKAAKSGCWQASAWRLERKFPQRWGRKICAEITAPDEKPPQPPAAEETKANQIDLSKLPADVLDEYHNIVEKILALTETPEPTKGQTP